MGRTQNGLEQQVNACVVGANRGKAIELKSAEMADIVAYIKSLKQVSDRASAAPAAKEAPKKKKSIEGC